MQRDKSEAIFAVPAVKSPYLSSAELTFTIIDYNVGSRMVIRCGKFRHFIQYCSVGDSGTGIVPSQIPQILLNSLFFK